MTGDDITAYPRPAVAVDLVILTVRDEQLQVLLVERDQPPFRGSLALPGGFVRVGEDGQGEDLEEAARRELAEETGLPGGSAPLRQLGAFGQAGRDPRMRVISVAWFALVRPDLAPLVRGGGDASSAGWYPTDPPPTLAFDHGQILDAALARVTDELDRGPIAFELVPEAFTIGELRGVYEVLQRQSLDPGNFRRKVLRMVADGVLEQAPGRRVTGTRRARLYRFVQPGD